jgi:hypothetical protein
MYPFIDKEVSRQKNVRIQVGVDVMRSLPKYDYYNKLSNVVQVAVPKGEYVVEKVFTEQLDKISKKSTGKKSFYYDNNVIINMRNGGLTGSSGLNILKQNKEIFTIFSNHFSPILFPVYLISKFFVRIFQRLI